MRGDRGVVPALVGRLMRRWSVWVSVIRKLHTRRDRAAPNGADEGENNESDGGEVRHHGKSILDRTVQADSPVYLFTTFVLLVYFPSTPSSLVWRLPARIDAGRERYVI